MSGTGQNDTQAPTRLTPITGDQPIAVTRDGIPSWPTMWVLQLFQRLLSYIGQPTSKNPPGVTISSQVGQLNNQMGPALFRPGVDGATLQQLATLRARVARLEATQAAPASIVIRPLPLPPPGLDRSQVMAIEFFGF